jgi:carbon monoxide dehydrogenase subunit G
MDLQNSFVVPADIDTAWQTLLDVESIAPCMPGATLDTVDGDTFTGSVKVKLGPVNMTYGGKAHFVEKDEARHRAVIQGTGKETRGSGTASALVTTQLVAEGPDRTRVDVTTDLTVTGKPAQFGRGVMQDVAGRIIDQFSANLAAVIAASGAQAAAASAAAAKGEPAPTAPSTPTPLPQASDSIDLLGTAGAPVLKRAIPAVLGIVAVIGIIWLIARRRG